ncbi:DUF2505 domain-containing protein [Nocardioides anomalus]|uniref:DUF2505 domain-containing protein n=1 Tax=Nocardioides anomalus TaxID=2712223 RepID=A0A6G6WGJ8_9ACTN|nr:DUF2505 domain-containing protein [Nocardioides anomalus]QIG44215.1 DUF2505 domain-containing protein [Nocardioides anomalus]
MTTRVTRELTYDAPAAEVHRMLTTASFRQEVCDRLRVVSATVSVHHDAVATEVVIDQVQRADGLPSIATKLLGDTVHVVQRERWTTPTRADVEVSVPGRPGEMRGTVRLEERGVVTVEVVELDVRVRVPLAGGRLEALVADLLDRALDVEHTTGQNYLSP